MDLSQNQNKHILVAMSGGVDSSMAAALLLEQGYQVTGLMLHLWCENEEENKCCTPKAVQQARSVASQLGFSFYVQDAEESFRKIVVGQFYDDYLAGKTPNPCYTCNRSFRWNILLKWAQSIGADGLATGHYARVERGQDGKYRLLRGLDDWKDQSYMLSGLNQAQLSQTIFPLGTLKKTEIRARASALNLPVATKEDSQDLCFLGNQDYRDFLKKHIPEVEHPGEIVNRKGEVIGRHDGLAFYTIGQRKGLNVPSSQPLYVLEKDINQNQLIVGSEDELGSSCLIADHFNWISEIPIESPQSCQVKIRYRAEFQRGFVEAVGKDMVKISFDEPLRDITPGQIAVVYDGETVLGSGIIRL